MTSFDSLHPWQAVLGAAFLLGCASAAGCGDDAADEMPPADASPSADSGGIDASLPPSDAMVDLDAAPETDGSVAPDASDGCVPTDELCDGVDNDCNSVIDDVVVLDATGEPMTDPATGEPVMVGDACDGDDPDMCALGTWVCPTDGAMPACDDPTDAFEVETCNRADDDCDGSVDDVTTVGMGCAVTNTSCSTQCVFATATDTAGTLSCVHSAAFDTVDGTVDAASVPAESCNGIDDDCDGSIDEDVPSTACSTICGTGTTTCVDGVAGCSAPSPGVASCTGGGDLDCDGVLDAVQTTTSAATLSGSVAFHRDVDQDGYYLDTGAAGPDETLFACPTYEAAMASMGFTLGSVATEADCCDSDASAHPGATAFHTSERTGCGGFDFDCDGVTSYRYASTSTTTATECTKQMGTCSDVFGWYGARPSCGDTATVQTGCSITVVCDCTTGGCCPPVTACLPDTESRTQGCR